MKYFYSLHIWLKNLVTLDDNTTYIHVQVKLKYYEDLIARGIVHQTSAYLIKGNRTFLTK